MAASNNTNNSNLKVIDTAKIRFEVNYLMEDSKRYMHKSAYTEMSKNDFITEMKNKYNYLHTNSTTLFEQAIKCEVNMEQLDYMLRMLDKVNKGADYHNTSVEIGQKLVDTYITPVLKK